MGLLDGRVAIVTGAGRGLGRAHALALAAAGAAVVVNDVVNDAVTRTENGTGGTSAAAQVVAEIVAAGGKAVADTSSVTDWRACAAIVDHAVAELGRLDILVNNAGVTRDRMLASATEEDLDLTLGVHVKGTYAMAHHACAYWRSLVKAGGDVTGRVINTTSGAGMAGNLGQTAYAAAKAAIIGFTLSLALEAGRYHVTANAVSPLARTRMTEQLMGTAPADGGFDDLAPENASGLVVYLASPAAGWLTGQVLRVEGNEVIRMDGWSAGPRYRSRDGAALEPAELVEAVPKLFGAAPGGLAGLGG
ncbi:SDR family NAD(P)-dependent oxidoreductase [Pseudonocardia xishanensis]|uniref:SDR family NAD(P)-dependent oxidoreductase n=1 Tax=Pseudonocardia xishanensis TaxID=630995 RepID=A0ABP8RGU6_9PSEU